MTRLTISITGYSDIKIQFNLDTNEIDVIYTDNIQQPVRIPLLQLSDGYKCTISLIADIAYRMAILNPQLLDNVVSETPGIILIDEIDLHLHPSWQRRILNDLTTIFPKVQFIVSTHAPAVISSIKSESLIILKDNDELISVRKTNGEKQVIIGASNGRLVRFFETEVRIMGRGSSGVRGIDLSDNETVVGAEIVTENEEVLNVTENGYGKKTSINEYRLTHRGSKGVKTLNITEKNGKLISLKTVNGDEDLIIITDNGMTIRISLDQISTLSRNTQGVRLITLKNNQKVSTVAIVNKEIEEENI